MVKKQLHRSKNNRILGGVAGGVAEYFDVDPAFIRIFIVLATLITAGTVPIIYIIMWIVLPEETTSNASENPETKPLKETVLTQPNVLNSQHHQNRGVFGVIIIGIGLWFLLENFGLLAQIGLHIYWPILIIAIGLFIILKR